MPLLDYIHRSIVTSRWKEVRGDYQNNVLEGEHLTVTQLHEGAGGEQLEPHLSSSGKNLSSNHYIP